MAPTGLLQPVRPLKHPRWTTLLDGPAARCRVYVTHNAALVLLEDQKSLAVYRQQRGGLFTYRETQPLVGRLAPREDAPA